LRHSWTTDRSSCRAARRGFTHSGDTLTANSISGWRRRQNSIISPIVFVAQAEFGQPIGLQPAHRAAQFALNVAHPVANQRQLLRRLEARPSRSSRATFATSILMANR